MSLLGVRRLKIQGEFRSGFITHREGQQLWLLAVLKRKTGMSP